MLKRNIRYFDRISLALITILALLGIAFIYSATYLDVQPVSNFIKKQSLGVLSGFLIYFAFSFLDDKKLCYWGYRLYFFMIGLLIFTLVKGSIGMGGQRWISLGLFKFQPSELMKLFFPAYFVYYLENRNDAGQYNFYDFINVFMILIFTCLLIRKQPDLGTAIVIFLSGLTMLWLSGISKKFFIWAFAIFIITAPISWQFLKDYQKKRIEVFFGAGEVQKERYQIEQSIIAIGSGGLTGKGFLEGTQNRLEFLPENHTDFIFSVLCEEWGFIGALMLLILFGLLFLRILFKIQKIQNFFAKLLAAGLFAPIILSSFINIAMVTGLLPTVGIPLPFLSYGISHLWVTLAGLGWINGIIMRNPEG